MRRQALARCTAGLLLAAAGLACAGEFTQFDTRGLPRSQGLVVRVNHPPHWKRVPVDDEMALAELRGSEAGGLTGILQIGRGRPRKDLQAQCGPERARTMLQGLSAREPDARVTDVVARTLDGRPAFELRYQRSDAPGFLLVRSVIVCLKDSKLVVSCGATGPAKDVLAAIEPVCRRVLDSLSVAED